MNISGRDSEGNSYGLIAFDLEGPLSPQDNAYEVMGLTEKGYEVFERLSRYDDILTLEERPDYEPGDTLYLILPFLIAEGISMEDILNVSKKAALTPGAEETVKALKVLGYPLVIISTSYQPHAHYIGERLGITPDCIASTPFPSERVEIRHEEKKRLLSLKETLLKISPGEDESLKKVLDQFYLKELPEMGFYKRISGLKVVGGRRKVSALKEFMERFKVAPSRTVSIGDSITDFRMLDYINKSGGLAIVFNGNEYSVPYATIGVASESLLGVVKPVEIFFKEGAQGVKEFIQTVNSQQSTVNSKCYYTLIEGCEDLDSVIAIHKLMRRKIRGKAAQLG
jgi:energy-converting hydrogenase A subunit R